MKLHVAHMFDNPLETVNYEGRMGVIVTNPTKAKVKTVIDAMRELVIELANFHKLKFMFRSVTYTPIKESWVGEQCYVTFEATVMIEFAFRGLKGNIDLALETMNKMINILIGLGATSGN